MSGRIGGVHLSLMAEEIFSLGGFVITNSFFVAMVVAVFLMVGLSLMARRMQLAPGVGQGILEVVTHGILGMMDTILNDRRKSEKYFPLIATLFLFILFSNWSGILPGVGSIGVWHITGGGYEELIPILRPPGADLNFTLALAVTSVLMIQILGMMAVGFWRYLNKFFTLKNPIYTFVGLLELVSEFAKMISFSFRLFGNIFAGEVLLVIIAFLLPLFLPVPFLFLEMFVGFMQAFVFATLTLVFIAIATVEH